MREMDEKDYRYEINELRYKLQKANEEIVELESRLGDEQSRHHTTANQRDEYKGRAGQAYDAYVSYTPEDYISPDDYETLEQICDEQAARIAKLESQNADLEALLREIINEPPVTGERNMPPLCAFCGAVYDNPHTEDCWITRVEKALNGEE
jgi:chromosome segregation ATPase